MSTPKTVRAACSRKPTEFGVFGAGLTDASLAHSRAPDWATKSVGKCGVPLPKLTQQPPEGPRGGDRIEKPSAHMPQRSIVRECAYCHAVDVFPTTGEGNGRIWSPLLRTTRFSLHCTEVCLFWFDIRLVSGPRWPLLMHLRVCAPSLSGTLTRASRSRRSLTSLSWPITHEKPLRAAVLAPIPPRVANPPPTCNFIGNKFPQSGVNRLTDVHDPATNAPATRPRADRRKALRGHGVHRSRVSRIEGHENHSQAAGHVKLRAHDSGELGPAGSLHHP